jgi:hypothetical protein
MDTSKVDGYLNPAFGCKLPVGLFYPGEWMVGHIDTEKSTILHIHGTLINLPDVLLERMWNVHIVQCQVTEVDVLIERPLYHVFEHRVVNGFEFSSVSLEFRM